MNAHAQVTQLIRQLETLVENSSLPEDAKHKLHDATFSLKTVVLAHVEPVGGIDWFAYRLTAMERAIAQHLHNRLGKPVNTHMLYDALYGCRNGDGPDTKIISVAVSHMRAKLHSAGAPFGIQGHWGFGYSMVAAKDCLYVHHPRPEGKRVSSRVDWEGASLTGTQAKIAVRLHAALVQGVIERDLISTFEAPRTLQSLRYHLCTLRAALKVKYEIKRIGKRLYMVKSLDRTRAA